ncbi:MAG: hypothetical protein IIV62_04095, partial [Anaerotignum sp.]|nr:hypothetical protein [Anaerotignum sp.]
MIAEYSMAEVGRQAAIVIEKLGAHEVCGICAEEISRSIALQNRMILEGGFTIEDVERIVGDHDERLEQAEAVADAKQAVIDQKVDEQVFPEDVDPYFEEEKAESSGGGGSSSGGGSAAPPAGDEPETPPADSGELEEADLTRQVGSEAELLDALDEYNALAGTMEITLTGDITMDANALNELMMERNGGKAALTINTAGNTLTLAAPIENYGDLTITGGGNISVAGDAAIINAGTLTLENVAVTSTYSDESEYENEPIGIRNEAGATLNMTGGSINSEYIGLQNDGTATISSATITADDGAPDDEQGYAIGIANSGNLTIGEGVVISSNGIGIDNYNAYGGYSLRASRASAASGVVNMAGGSIIVNRQWATGIRNDSDGCQILISGGTITVSAPDAVGIDNQSGFVNFVTNEGVKWTIKVTDGAGIGMFSSVYIDGEWVDTDAEEEALEAMIDATAPGVALLWPQA